MKILLPVFLSLCFMIVPSMAQAKSKIAVMSALDSDSGRGFFSENYYDINRKIQTRIRAELGEKYDITFYKRVDLQVVWEVLHNSDFEGVLFIGHSTGESKSNSPVSLPAFIADTDLNDLKNAFQSVHPGLKFLGVVGCNSKSIFDSFSSKGYYSNAPQLKIKSFDEKIELWKGISETLINADKVLSASPAIVIKKAVPAAKSVKKYTVIINRTIPYGASADYVRPTFLMKDDKVITFFPRRSGGVTQRVGLLLTEDEMKTSFTFVHDSGVNSTHQKPEVELGELSLEVNGADCTLEPITNSRNEIMGIGKHYYKMKCASQKI